MTNRPRFAALCDEAAAQGMTVGLKVGERLLIRGEGYRRLTRIELRQGASYVAAQDIAGDDVEAAALLLRARLVA